MRFNLRNFVLAPAVMAAAALATNTAMAETTLKVPFNFTVDGKNCPAGLYTVQRESTHNSVTLTSKATQRSFTWIIAPGDPAPTASAVTLTFDELGQTHTLRSVQYGPMVTSRLDQKTKESEHAPTRIVQGQ
jgi:hypothetical protein